MTDLVLEPNLDDPDGFLAELLAAHETLNPDESAALNARLVLILANQLGDAEALSAAIELARTARRS